MQRLLADECSSASRSSFHDPAGQRGRLPDPVGHLHRVDRARWYAIALLTAPVVMAVEYLALSLASPAFVPGILTAGDTMSRLIFGLVAGVVVGILEEIGWTGFATPILLRRHTILATGLMIGVLWGAWHVIGQVVFASGTYAGGLPFAAFLAMRTVGLLIGGLPAYRVLTVWVYDRTGSLFVAMVMHMSLTAATLIFEPVGISGMSLIVLDVVSILVWWGVVAVFAAVCGWTFAGTATRTRAG
jgi:uncharacterized protein